MKFLFSAVFAASFWFSTAHAVFIFEENGAPIKEEEICGVNIDFPEVCLVKTKYTNITNSGVGTGVLIHPRLVMTARHVVDHARYVELKFGKQIYAVDQMFYVHEYSDIAFLALKEKVENITPRKLAPLKSVEQLKTLTMMGYGEGGPVYLDPAKVNPRDQDLFMHNLAKKFHVSAAFSYDPEFLFRFRKNFTPLCAFANRYLVTQNNPAPEFDKIYVGSNQLLQYMGDSGSPLISASGEIIGVSAQVAVGDKAQVSISNHKSVYKLSNIVTGTQWTAIAFLPVSFGLSSLINKKLCLISPTKTAAFIMGVAGVGYAAAYFIHQYAGHKYPKLTEERNTVLRDVYANYNITGTTQLGFIKDHTSDDDDGVTDDDLKKAASKSRSLSIYQAITPSIIKWVEEIISKLPS